MPRTLLLALLLLVPALAGCLGAVDQAPAAADAPRLDGGHVVAYEKIHTPAEITAILQNQSELPGVNLTVIGESGEGRPLHKVVVGDGPIELWTVGRQHGDEPTGGEAILQAISLLGEPDAELPDDAPPVLRTFLEHRELLKERATFVFVPVGNPDGAAAFQRGNARGVDLNRDHWAFTQPESQAMRDAFWEHWPDECIDLHNEGTSQSYDYDAFMPRTLPESEMQRQLIRSAWQTVYEVDAAGGFGGGPNENYVLVDDPVRVENPTTFHPGTHDMFCSLRGAPGWTPEGAIPADDGPPVDDPHAYGWSTRLHLITIASEALGAAGLYDGYLPTVVDKQPGGLTGPEARHRVDVPEDGDARIQVVWRQPAPRDKNPVPVRVEVVGPEGTSHEARKPMPESFTATVDLDDARKGTYLVRIQGPVGLDYEVRTYVQPTEPQHVLVQRTDEGLRIEDHSPLKPHVTLTDVVDADVDVSAYDPPPDRVFAWNGTIAPRKGLVWELDLGPSQVVEIDTPGRGNPGPYRWTATFADRVFTDVEAARSTE